MFFGSKRPVEEASPPQTPETRQDDDGFDNEKPRLNFEDFVEYADSKTDNRGRWSLPPRDSKPKKVASRRRLTAILLIARYHIGSLAVTFWLVGMYATGWIWYPPGPSQDTLSALQFVAKIHEGLIILSLSNILLHRVRYLLMSGTDGVPLGFITAPWQLSSPLYFVDSEFWGSAVRSVTAATHLGTLLLIVVCLVLSIAIGPFSAIVILPQVGTWPMPTWVPGMKGYLADRAANQETEGGFRPYSFAVNASELYPTDVGPSMGMTWECVDSAEGCLSMFNERFDSIILQSVPGKGAGGGGYSDYISTDEPCAPYNVTAVDVWLCLTDNVHPLSDEIIYAENVTYTGVGIATSPTMLQSGLMWRDLSDRFVANIDWTTLEKTVVKTSYSDAAGQRVPVKQPLVAVQCREGHFNWTDFQPGANVWFPNGIYPEFNLTVDETLSDMVWNLNLSRPANASFLTYFDMQPYMPPSHTLSTAMLMVEPYYDMSMNEMRPDYRAVQLCYAVARWVESDIWIDKMSGYARSRLVGGPVETLVNETEQVDPSKIIRIDPEWMMKLNNPRFTGSRLQNVLGEAGDGRPVSSYDFLAGACITDVNCLTAALSAMLSETLKGVQCAFTPCFDADDTDSSGATYNYTRLRTFTEADVDRQYVNATVEYFIVAYGYSLESGWLVVLGLVVLLLHAVIVVVHILLIACGGWSSDAWGQLGELLVLALNSTAPKLLRANSAGVRGLSTWQLSASIREKLPDGGLEMLINSRGRDEEIRGDLERVGDMETKRVPPQADKKYG
ncbi:hypothetical protein B0H63DRAFT_77186 [Podospora didyma]|uniref:Uncharacterized protein n=1 Tax=Podospora didyma TaxID=330526 RepID=A0AAE0K1Z4_9PEZI|nr:hypothetical protein B0H63DRAFT_77186 [Podospora didyma]